MSGQSRVTKDNYAATLVQTWALAFLIEDAPIIEMLAAAAIIEILAAAEHADAIGAFVDQTAYRDKIVALHEDMEMLRALRHVQTTLESIRRRRAGR